MFVFLNLFLSTVFVPLDLSFLSYFLVRLRCVVPSIYNKQKCISDNSVQID